MRSCWVVVVAVAGMMGGCGFNPLRPTDHVRSPLVITVDDTFLRSVYPDIPDTAKVYGMGTVFAPKWTGQFSAKVYLGTDWKNVGSLKIRRYLVTGEEYTIALWCDGRMIVEGIAVRKSTLTWVEYQGSKPWGNLWNTFSLERDKLDSVQVYVEGDNRSSMVSTPIVYDGWSETIDDSCKTLNGPTADPSYPVMLESNLSWGSGVQTLLYWDSKNSQYGKVFRALATGGNNDYYVVVTVASQSPFRRTWGVYAGARVELEHLFKVTSRWYVFLFGFKSDGTLIQLGDNRCSST